MSPSPKATTAPNTAASWFSRVVWLGIAFNLLFIVPQVFAPDFINMAVDLPPGFSTIWNQAHGMMVLALSLFYIPAALDPLRYPAYSWLLVVSRLIAAGFWAYLSGSSPAFVSYLITDGAFGVIEGLLLQRALPLESKA